MKYLLHVPIVILNVIVTTNTDTLTMPAGTKFSASIDDTSFSFVTISDITGTNTSGQIVFSETPVYEGTYVTSTYTVDTSDVSQRFLLTDNRLMILIHLQLKFKIQYPILKL